ncbi:MAG TPA: sigma-70 family RNA polymerase sigma factor [Sedimentisphaerales bacterium]|nr:sigma-70 family RNA polymerase sigma factor [Sedimentisphaerales bacterium]
MAEAGQQRSGEALNGADAGATLTPEVLVRKYSSAVLGLCIAHTKNFHDSEDIMQEVFLRAMTKLRTLRDETRVRPWLLKIARRTCIDYYRKRPTARPLAGDMPAAPDRLSEQAARVHQAVSRLPEQYREPIALYYLDGRNCAAVAHTLGISEQAVRQRLVRARLMLHELLSEDKS